MPVVVKETDCAVPETRVAMMVFETEDPWVTDMLPPLVREKLKAGAPLMYSYAPIS